MASPLPSGEVRGSNIGGIQQSDVSQAPVQPKKTTWFGRLWSRIMGKSRQAESAQATQRVSNESLSKPKEARRSFFTFSKKAPSNEKNQLRVSVDTGQLQVAVEPRFIKPANRTALETALREHPELRADFQKQYRKQYSDEQGDFMLDMINSTLHADFVETGLMTLDFEELKKIYDNHLTKNDDINIDSPLYKKIQQAYKEGNQKDLASALVVAYQSILDMMFGNIKQLNFPS